MIQRQDYTTCRAGIITQSGGRFLNADGTTLDTGATLIGHNMYVYCANNPIIKIDPTGKMALIGLVIGVTVGLIGFGTTTQSIINSKDLRNA